ncbi:hypothetical protein [Streptomyces sp. NPDC046759]|uniref:hypothetical protein n=1 Tax=Streptomyces sp. NPDC046759 TaxID=3155019 RepID=UPI0033F82129
MRTYWGGCDKEWGLSYGVKDPNWLCPHDPLPSASASASSSASASASASASPSASSGGNQGNNAGSNEGSNEGSSDGSVALGRLAGPPHSSKHHHSARPSATAEPSPMVQASPTVTSSHGGHVRHHRKPHSLPAGPSETPPATSGSDEAQPPAAVGPQGLPSAENPPGSPSDGHTGVGRPAPDDEPNVAGQADDEDD